MLKEHSIGALVDERTPRSYVGILAHQALVRPTAPAYSFLSDNAAVATTLSYAGLDRRARAIASLLQQRGLSSSARALLLYPPGLDYIAAFFGCLYAGIPAIPAYPPKLNRLLSRLQPIVADAQASIALTTREIASRGSGQPELSELRWLTTEQIALSLADEWEPPSLGPSSLALIQYTSGSTATPKGVMLTHGNLLANSALIQRCFATDEHSRGVFWLPPYHDMGLIGGLLQTIYCGGSSVLMSPISFLQSPLRWLQAISRSRATISGAPNFAYDLCARVVSAEQRAELNLSSWRLAFSGAEPVRAETLERFVEAFAGCGFRWEALFPCYGLAESTLLVSGKPAGQGPLIRSFRASALEQHRAEACAQDEPAARRLVSSGSPLPGHQLLIVDPHSLKPCAPGQIGEIWVSGPSVAQGYWNQPGQSERSFGVRLEDARAERFLRTGDLGFLEAGELFITGRLKDLLIIRGRNYYPQDLEQTVQACHSGLTPGAGAAFSVEIAGEERLVVIQELDRQQRQVDLDQLASLIRQALAEEHALQAHAIVLIRAGSILRTSSGKVRRQACKADYLEGKLALVGASVLEETTAQPAAADEPPPAPEELLGLAEGEARARLGRYLSALCARLLRVSAGALSTAQPLSSFGLDSLAAVELQHQLEQTLGVALTIGDLLQGATLDQLAERLYQSLGRSQEAPASLAEQPPPVGLAQELSAGQRALWFLHQLAPESTAYSMPTAVRIRGPLDLAALREAFQGLVERHTVLRASFPLRQGLPRQEISTELASYLVVEDGGWDEQTLRGRLEVEAQRPFDMAHGPLFRALLLRGAETEHLLLLNLHHSVGDLWSMAVLTRDIEALYSAALGKQTPALPALPWDYLRYSAWEQSALAGERGQQLWRYWQGRLSGELPVLELPLDRPRPPVQRYQGALHSMQLGTELTSQLKLLGEREGLTLYMLLLAAFQLLLHRYSGQEDILVGSPASGRGRAELANMVGYFVNPLVLRSQLGGNPSVSALLQQVREGVIGALEHQDLPFPLLVERLQPRRDPSRSPIFQVMFALQSLPQIGKSNLSAFALGAGDASLNLAGIELELVPLGQQVAQFDLGLTIGETAGKLLAAFEYNTDLFEAATIAQMGRHFQRLLEEMVAHPRARIGELRMLSPEEERRTLALGNAAASYPQDLGVHQLFVAQARRAPEATALIVGDQRLSYQELERRARQLALRLVALGAGPEIPVGIYMDRSAELIVGMLGVLMAGAAYVPLDPLYPAERLALIMCQTAMPIVVTHKRLAQELPAHALALVTLEDDQLEQAPPEQRLEMSPVSSGQLACMIFTSGSTGTPKAVMLTHGGIANLITSFIESYKVDAQDRLLPLTSLASASFVGEVFPPLCVGGGLVLPSYDEVLDVGQLAGLIGQHGISIVSSVPSMLATLNARAESLPRLRLILSGGEPLAPGEADQLLERAVIVNGYGLSETTVCSSFYVLESGAQLRGRIPIGKPIINTSLYVLDPDLRCVPAGLPGELYVAGAGLARGYLNNPGLSAERFLPNPYASGERMYRTGDLARWLPDGNLEYLGRIDQQVKLRGFRIELGEIEARLEALPCVKEAAVLLREERMAAGRVEKRLVAYLVPAPAFEAGQQEQAASQIAQVRSLLKQQLPDYMLPAAYVLMEALPRNANGKLNQVALPEPERQRAEPLGLSLAPANQLERTIGEVWRQALNLEAVGLHENFFDLGGHSILLAQVHSALQPLFPQLALMDLFRHPTISALALHLEHQTPGQQTAPAIDEVQARAQKQREARDRRRNVMKDSGRF